MKINFIDGTNVASTLKLNIRLSLFQLELGRIEREKIWGKIEPRPPERPAIPLPVIGQTL